MPDHPSPAGTGTAGIGTASTAGIGTASTAGIGTASTAGIGTASTAGIGTASTAGTGTAGTATGDPEGSNNGSNNGAATLSGYRRRWTWDQVTWGTHCLNCMATCPYRVYVRDGEVAFEEPGGTIEAIEPGVPDMNPLGCQKGAAWSQQLNAPDRITTPLRRVGRARKR